MNYIKKSKHKRLRRKKSYNPAGLYFIVFWIVLAAGFAKIYNTSYRPVLYSAAKYRAEYILNEKINSAIDEVFKKIPIEYEDIVKTETDSEGNITSAKINLIYLNTFKASLLNTLGKALNSDNRADIYIPLGNLIGSDIFSGIGPMIKTTLITAGSASAEFKNSFTYSGINQTRHLVSMEITAKLSYLLPGTLSDETSLKTEVPIAESIIAGSVPESLTDLETDINSIRDDLMNLQ